MKERLHFLRTPLRAGVPVLAAMCLSVAGTAIAAEKAAPAPAAAEKAAQKPAVKMTSSAGKKAALVPAQVQFAEMRTKEIEAILEKLKQAEIAANEKSDFESAIKALNEAEKLLAKGQGSIYLDKVRERYQNDLSAIGVLAGEKMFQDAKSKYSQALYDGATENGAALAKEAKLLAGNAKFLFYTGRLPEHGVTQDMLDNAITPRNSDFSARVEQLIQACTKIEKAQDFRSQTDTSAVDPNYANRQQQISELYALAEKLYKKQKYTEARNYCERIFIQDPYNQAAIRLLDKIYKKLYFYSELRAYNEMLRVDAETIWAWTPGVPSTADKNTRVLQRSSANPLIEKLNDWKISVDFKDLSVTDAINEIRDLSRKADPSGNGINFNPSIPTSVPNITLRAEDMPISQVLTYLCQLANISWSTDDMFVRIGTGIGDYDKRTIPMRNSVYMSITGKGEGESSGSGEGTDLIDIAKGVENATVKQKKISDEDLKKFFVERGIPFDDQCYIGYNKKTHALSVTNTRENLQKLEVLVREIDVENPLVLIEAKLLEIYLSDQEELGFDWTVTYHNEDSKAWDFTMSSPMRALDAISNDKIINQLNVVPNAKFNGGHTINVYLTVTAVDRTDRVELLSTPKVVAKSGEEAVIKMVKQMYFPDSWTEPDTSNTNGTSFEFEPSHPEFSEAQDVGINFTVTPQVSSNNKMVTLTLLPSVTDLTGWTDYSYDVIMQKSSETTTGGGSSASTTGTSTTSHVTMIMPEISERSVETMVKVYDGQSMLIGGMMIDNQQTLEDRFPILGDIPILGRLFGKYANVIERSNLVISVSTRLISGDGVPINNNSAIGLPDFRR